RGQRAHFEMAWRGRVFQGTVEGIGDPEKGITGVLGLAVDITGRKEAEAALEKQLRLVQLLNEVTQRIAHLSEIPEIYAATCELVERDLPCDGAAFLTTDGVTIRLSSAGPSGQQIFSFLKDEAWSLNRSPFSPCLNRERVIIDDLTEQTDPLSQRLVPIGQRGCIGLPVFGSEVVTALFVATRKGSFSQEEQDIVKAIVDYASQSIRKIEIHQNLVMAYEELRRTQNLALQQARLAAIGQMASGIAHHINNALTPIVAYSELLAETEQEMSEQGRLYLSRMRSAAQDIANTVARIRSFYRLPRRPELPQPLSVNDLILSALDFTRVRWSDILQQSGFVIRLVTDLTEDLPPILGSETDIREALVNLILNACDAMPDGGTLTIRSQRGTIPETKTDAVVVSVEDTGIGMDEETKSRCLEPFFSTKEEHGTGLGLTIVYGVVQRHQGAIEIDSALGQGTKVRLYFPIQPVADKVSVSPPFVARLRPLRILCVDDEESIRSVLKDLLTRDSHQVELTSDGPSALKMFEESLSTNVPFDLVITDLGMPGMDGRQVAAKIKELSPTTPVLLFTGWGAIAGTEELLPEAVDEVLFKPPQLSQLRSALARLSSGKSAPRSS
ncbi:MAG: response regulator, partial [Armatimonadetes bacterium]|nr:response regulator [Armatimonadota bacterium]